MKKLLYYLPSLLTIVVILSLDEGLAKWSLLFALIFFVVLAKYKRNKLISEDVEYDERVNTNARNFSFVFLVVMIVLLIIYLILVSLSIITNFISIDCIMVYLSITLYIALYIVPSIAKIL